MPRTIFSTSVYPRIAACAAAVLLVSSCENVPKYKKTSGKFDEWKSYEGKHFKPSDGTVTAIDTTANTVTIGEGKVFPVTSATRIIHEGSDITLAQLPLNQRVKYTLSEDGQRLLIIWYGQRLYQAHGRSTEVKKKNTFF